MSLVFMRVVSFIVLPISAVFFIANLVFTAYGKTLNDLAEIRSTVLVVGFLAFYMVKVDKEYLVKSIPLRVIGAIAGASGLVALFWR